MNVHNDLQGLQQLFAPRDVAQTSAGKRADRAEAGGADEATLSSAASALAQAGPDADVRMEKVAAVQKALAEGTYAVSAQDVAGKMMEGMLGQ